MLRGIVCILVPLCPYESGNQGAAPCTDTCSYCNYYTLYGKGHTNSAELEFADENADPQRDHERHNIRRRFEEEVRRLPVVFREVIILRDILELSYEEISSILEIPLGTVKSRVNRGRLRLQKRLKDLL